MEHLEMMSGISFDLPKDIVNKIEASFIQYTAVQDAFATYMERQHIEFTEKSVDDMLERYTKAYAYHKKLTDTIIGSIVESSPDRDKLSKMNWSIDFANSKINFTESHKAGDSCGC